MNELPTDVSLSEPQLAVMRALWAKPGSSVAEVAEALRSERALAHTTVATMLTRLEKRALVASTRDGRQFTYRATVTESQVRRSMVSGLLTSLFRGDAAALLSHLVREDDIDASDLERMRALLGNPGDRDV
ncbi:MAG: BlaI/MecI/CopY family transcriptional regulator [Pseudomonadota bacterium]